MTLGDMFPAVLEAGRAGAHWALERLYQDLASTVLGYLRGQGAAEPEDLASDVFVGVVRGLPRFRGDERAFRSWVFSIAHRRLMDERRRLARRREEPVDPAEMTGSLAATSTGDAEAEAMARVEGYSVIQMMRALSHDQRAVLLLRVLADLSVEDVAGILGKSQGAIKALQRRALTALLRHMDREGVT